MVSSTRVAFTEGQDVKANDVLAQIDPRSFQAALDQAKATQVKDEAQLANARLDLKRFVDLGEFATRQSVDTQQALVRQLEATVQADAAAVENAQIQLDYTTIRAPLSGRTGLRLVDPGNIVHATDPNGLVVITQLQPISVVFTLPQDQLPEVVKGTTSGTLKAIATARTNGNVLGEGRLAVVNNQIDSEHRHAAIEGNLSKRKLCTLAGAVREHPAARAYLAASRDCPVDRDPARAGRHVRLCHQAGFDCCDAGSRRLRHDGRDYCHPVRP